MDSDKKEKETTGCWFRGGKKRMTGREEEKDTNMGVAQRVARQRHSA